MPTLCWCSPLAVAVPRRISSFLTGVVSVGQRGDLLLHCLQCFGVCPCSWKLLLVSSLLLTIWHWHHWCCFSSREGKLDFDPALQAAWMGVGRLLLLGPSPASALTSFTCSSISMLCPCSTHWGTQPGRGQDTGEHPFPYPLGEPQQPGQRARRCPQCHGELPERPAG